jgi:zinc transporter ZupT
MLRRARTGWRNPVRRGRAITTITGSGSVTLLGAVVAVAVGPGALRWVLAVMAAVMAGLGAATAYGNLTGLPGFYLGDDE